MGPLRQFDLDSSDHPNHRALGRALRAYLRWRNAHAPDPELLDTGATGPGCAANNNDDGAT